MRKPEWLRTQMIAGDTAVHVKRQLASRGLHTVCESAKCPNSGECWKSGTATFLIGGNRCTRACKFCAIESSERPEPLDEREPLLVAESAAQMALRYVVVTGVTRDDLSDGSAGHYARVIASLRERMPHVRVEVLTPDFQGKTSDIQTVISARPDVFAHNIETVKELQGWVRDRRASSERSLEVLRLARKQGEELWGDRRPFVKSGMMLGLGETREQILQTLQDLREAGCELLTLGQYLRPSMQHLPVDRYVHPDEFAELKVMAENMGFLGVFSGPLVRSSYKAGELFVDRLLKMKEGVA